MHWHERLKPFIFWNLSAYSPDLNPIERLWLPLKSHGLAGCLT